MNRRNARERRRARRVSVRAGLLAGACALFAAASAAAGTATAPTVIREVAGPDTVLMASLSRPEGVWQVWEARTTNGPFDYVLQPGRAPQNLAGGQCPAAKKRTAVSVCLWGGIDRHYDAAIGRTGGRIASLQARTARGDAVRVARGRGGIYLVVSSHQQPATVLTARDAEGDIVARRRIGSPGGG